MEFCKALFAAIFIVALTAPLSSGLSDAEIVIRGVLMPTLANATKEVEKFCCFSNLLYATI